MTDVEKIVNENHDAPRVELLQAQLRRANGLLSRRGRQVQKVIYAAADAAYSFKWTTLVILLVQFLVVILMVRDWLDGFWATVIIWGLLSVVAYNAGRCAALRVAKKMIQEEPR